MDSKAGLIKPQALITPNHIDTGMKRLLIFLMLASISFAALPDIYNQNKAGFEAQVKGSLGTLKYALPLTAEINLLDDKAYVLTIAEDGSTSLAEGKNIDANVRVRTTTTVLEQLMEERIAAQISNTDTFLFRANGVKGNLIKTYIEEKYGITLKGFEAEDRGAIGNFTFGLKNGIALILSFFAGLVF